MAGAADYTAPEDPDEPVIAVTGKHAFPRHPATMKEPYVYKLTFLGPAGAGRVALHVGIVCPQAASHLDDAAREVLGAAEEYVKTKCQRGDMERRCREIGVVFQPEMADTPLSYLVRGCCRCCCVVC